MLNKDSPLKLHKYIIKTGNPDILTMVKLSCTIVHKLE